MKRSILLFFVIVSALAGCAPKTAVKVDLDTYLQHRGQYQGKAPVITASVADLLLRYGLYKNMDVEVAGTVAYYGSKNFWTWYVLLENGGKSLRCYAHQYRVEPGRDALHMVRWAQSEKGVLTLQGRVKNDGIEIVYMKYKGDTVTPYYKPTDHYFLPLNTVPLIR